MILKLVVPRRKNVETEKEKWGWEFQAILWGTQKHNAMLLSIPVLAGLTPNGIDIVIQDENIECINFDEKVDLVGITSNIFMIERAYEIADEFRKRKIPVILGGIHASVLSDEALRHADSILIGEAEDIWGQIIEDAKNNALKKIYQSEKKPDLNNQPIPRYDLIKNKSYSFHLLQTSRGCPNDCDFCSVQNFNGRRYRCKSVEKVMSELDFLLSVEKKLVFIVDDNFTANKERAKKILRSMMPLKTPFTIQATVDIYEDDELLELLVNAGCLSVFIGFESLDQKVLSKSKRINKKDLYFTAIEKIQSKGLIVLGAFMVGFDDDKIDVFENTVNFVSDSGLGNSVVSILTPLPGTGFYDRIRREERLLAKSWSHFDCSNVCFIPKNMSEKELQNGYLWSLQRIFDLNVTWDRLMKLYNLWNKNNVRFHERLFPLINNLASHHMAYTYPLAQLPK